MSIPRHLRDALSAIKGAGGLVVKVTHGKHIKIIADFGNGPRLLVCAVSPSDGRAILNFRRDVAHAKQGVRHGSIRQGSGEARCRA